MADAPTTLATIPVGYGDGVRRALTNDADVLIGGRRRPLRGTVSMDNVTVDLGAGGAACARGGGGADRRAGRRADPRRGVGRAPGTINYEIVCGISARVPRAYHRDGAPAA